MPLPRDEGIIYYGEDTEIEIFSKTSFSSIIDAPAVITPMPIVPMPTNSSDDFYDPKDPNQSKWDDFSDFNDFNDSPSKPESEANAVYGGKTFVFTVELLNTHKSIAVKDLKVTISQASGVFNPKSGANTFFIERLEPGESTEVSIELLVKADTVPDSYALTIDFSYKSESGESVAAPVSEKINIPVQQEMRFSMGDLAPIDMIEMGDDAYVSVQFGNLGRSLIYNVIVRVQGDGFTNMTGTHYAGNINAGDFKKTEFNLTPYMAGFLSGMFIFSYEDAEGNVFEEYQQFSFNVIGEEETMDPNWNENENNQQVINPDGDEESEGFWLFTDMNLAKWAIVIGGGLVILAAVITIIAVIVRKRKKSKSDDDDEDL